MGLFDRLDKFYRKNFVSHNDKFKEQHGQFVVTVLNKIYNDEYDPYEFPKGLKRSNNLISCESELCILNEVPINTISLCEYIAVLCFCDNYAVEGGVEDSMVMLSKRIANGSQNKLTENEVLNAIKKCSQFYKNATEQTEDLPNFLSLYFEGWDVETDGYLDNIFKSFYIIQGNVLFISNHSLKSKSDIISSFFVEKGYKNFSDEEHLFDENRINKLDKNNITINHLKLINSQNLVEDWNYFTLLETVKNIAVFSGYSDQKALDHYIELTSKLNDQVYNFNEISKLGLLFFYFNNNDGLYNSGLFPDLIGIVYRTENSVIA
jgi:hypothetical protein